MLIGMRASNRCWCFGGSVTSVRSKDDVPYEKQPNKQYDNYRYDYRLSHLYISSCYLEVLFEKPFHKLREREIALKPFP